MHLIWRLIAHVTKKVKNLQKFVKGVQKDSSQFQELDVISPSSLAVSSANYAVSEMELVL